LSPKFKVVKLKRLNWTDSITAEKNKIGVDYLVKKGKGKTSLRGTTD
jgi:hypothetical protein